MDRQGPSKRTTHTCSSNIYASFLPCVDWLTVQGWEKGANFAVVEIVVTTDWFSITLSSSHLSSKGGIYHVLYRLLYRLHGFAVLESKQQHGGKVIYSTLCLSSIEMKKNQEFHSELGEGGRGSSQDKISTPKSNSLWKSETGLSWIKHIDFEMVVCWGWRHGWGKEGIVPYCCLFFSPNLFLSFLLFFSFPSFFPVFHSSRFFNSIFRLKSRLSPFSVRSFVLRAVVPPLFTSESEVSNLLNLLYSQ